VQTQKKNLKRNCAPEYTDIPLFGVFWMVLLLVLEELDEPVDEAEDEVEPIEEDDDSTPVYDDNDDDNTPVDDEEDDDNTPVDDEEYDGDGVESMEITPPP